jgi:tetratricopeptide (TPR) repeat protein
MYGHVVTAAYAFHDMMLGRLLELAGDDATVLLVSDHGYQRTDAPTDSAEANHRAQGIWVMHGPHVRRGAELCGASLLDVTPTILSLFGIASGLDMPGRPWVEAIDAGPSEVETDRLLSWDPIGGDAGLHPADRTDEQDPSHQAIAHLLELGYSEPRDQRSEEAVRRAREQNQYNLARSLIDAGEHARAAELLEPLFRRSPANLAYGQSLLRAYLAMRRCKDALELVDLAARHGAPAALVDVAMGAIELGQRRPAAALDHLRRAQAGETASAALHVLIGQGYRRLRCWPQAEQAFRKALELDEEDETAWHGLATTALAQDQNEQAAEAALHAISLRPDYAEAHYHLGVALAGLGKPHEAAVALQRCLALRSDMLAALRALAELYDGPLSDAARARAYRRDAHAIILQRRLSRRPETSPGTSPATPPRGAAPDPSGPTSR